MVAGLAVIIVASVGVHQTNMMHRVESVPNQSGSGTESGNSTASENETSQNDGNASSKIEEESKLIYFKDYDEIQKQIDSIYPDEYALEESGPVLGGFNMGNGSAVYKSADASGGAKESAAADSDTVDQAESADSVSANSASESSHSDTYEQVEGVSEADIIKTDGKYIYYVESDSYDIHIVSADRGKTENVSTITDNTSFTYYDNIYVSGDRLIAVGRATSSALEGYQEISAVIVYDISDRKNPKQESFYKQSGDLISSRMIGDYVYLVTSDYMFGSSRIVPYCSNSGKFEKMPASDICACPNTKTADYIVVGAVDTASGENAKVRTKAIMGASSDIYCNQKNLYLTATEYIPYTNDDVVLRDDTNTKDSTAKEDASVSSEDENTAENESAESGELEVEDIPVEDIDLVQNIYEYNAIYTSLVRVELNGGKIEIKANGRVPGEINNQFSMDEKDGYLRIATTSYKNSTQVNNLFVLDQKLERQGELVGFAKTEHIEAVRYIGKKAYVITYEQTDPLFIIDLSDPKKPKMEGHAKISGFSTLLIPENENTLLGIGFSTESTQFGEATNGLKFVTFNIADPMNPKIADSMSFENYESEIQYNHHALLVNKEKGYYAVPYINWGKQGYVDGNNMDSGVLVFKVKKDQSIDVIKQFKCKEEVSRCIYIEDWIYVLQPESNTFRSFRM